MESIKVIWHREFHVDYSQFPAIDWMARENAGKGIAPAPMYEITDMQVTAYELWRRKQKRKFSLSVYQSHFAEFAMYPHNLPVDFFDFHVNVLQRRHQAFIENRSETQPVIMLSPGVVIDECFDIEPYIKTAMEKDSLVVVGVSFYSHINLMGLWIVPPRIQKEFCRPIATQSAEQHFDDDVGFWLKRAGSTVFVNDSNLVNVLPAMADYTKKGEDMTIGELPLTGHKYPAWTTDDFRQWMTKQSFRLAQTMRWCPHEYIFMWNRTLESQMEYLLAIDYVNRNAIVDEWNGKFKLAAIVDGYKYWYVGVVDLLNRTSQELQRRIFAEDGKDENGRKINNK